MRRVEDARSAIVDNKLYTNMNDLPKCYKEDCNKLVRYEGSFVCEDHVEKYHKKSQYKSVEEIQKRTQEIITERNNRG